MHWYSLSISSYLRRGRFFTAFPGNDTNEYVLLLLLPLGRGVALAPGCGGWGGLAPARLAGCFEGEGRDCVGGEGRPVAETSEPLAALPAYKGERGELAMGASVSSSACLMDELQGVATECA